MNKKILLLLIIIALIILVGARELTDNNSNINSKNTTPTPTTPLAKQPPRPEFPQVEVALLYERVTDGALYGRGDSETINLLNETGTNFIFRGFWRWLPVPESPEDIPDELAGLLGMTQNQLKSEIEKSGYSHEQLRAMITKIKQDNQQAIFVGSIPAQKIWAVERNEKTGEIFEANTVSTMVLNPEKWGITLNPLQKLAYGDTLKSYPDITNAEFQNLLLSWAEKQIDDGVDAIWIDLLYSQAEGLKDAAGSVNHPAVKESYEAASKIVDEIHKYGNSKGKYSYVGTWAFPAINFPYSAPDLDFVTLTPSASEIAQKKLNEKSWVNNANKIKAKLGNIPIFVFIDWSDNDTPLSAFSQKLDKTEQNELIAYLDNFSKSKGMIFVYPVHGGNMGSNSKIRSFGMNNDYGRVYDSLAPEFDTFETIKQLASKNK